MKLTDRQKQVYLYIRKRIQEGVPPTILEICKNTRISSTNGVRCHLKALEQKGLIRREKKISRGIHLEPVLKVLDLHWKYKWTDFIKEDADFYSFSDLFQEGNVLTREGEVKRNDVVIATIMKVGGLCKLN